MTPALAGAARAGGCDPRSLRRLVSSHEPYPPRSGALQSRCMASTRTRTLRGALAGAAAAAVWAAQQPLDQRVFGVDYDDAELLGAPRHACARRLPGRARAAPRQRRAVRRASTRTWRPRLPVPARAARAARRAGRAPRDLAGHAASSTRASAPAAASRSCGARPARVRPGDLAPPAVRRGAGRARAAPEPARGASRSRSTPPPPPPTATARPSTSCRSTGSVERPHHRRRRGFAGRHLVAACRAGGDDVVAVSRGRRASTCATPRAARARRRERARPTSSTTSPRAPTSASPGRTRPASSPTTSAMTAQRARGGARRGARGDGRRRVGSGEEYGPPATLPVERGRAAAPAEPVRGLEGLRRPARRLLRRRPRPARDPRARVQPRRAGPGADLRDRLVRPPGRRGGRSAARPDRLSSPATRTPAATSPTCATSCAPTGCSPSAPSRASTTSARAARPPPASCSTMLAAVAGVGARPPGRSRPRARARGDGGARRAGPADRRRRAGRRRSRSSGRSPTPSRGGASGSAPGARAPTGQLGSSGRRSSRSPSAQPCAWYCSGISG